MDELIARLTDAAGIDQNTAQKAIEIILGFLKQSGPGDKVQQLLAAIPGAEDAVAGVDGGGGGGILGGMGGMMGAMGAMNQLTSAGLNTGQVQLVAREIVGFAREKAGDDVVDEVVSSIPGLSQFV